MKQILFLWVLFYLTSCSEESKTPQNSENNQVDTTQITEINSENNQVDTTQITEINSENNQTDKFEIPEIIQKVEEDTIKYLARDYLDFAIPVFINKFNFNKTIHIYDKADTLIPEEDFVEVYSNSHIVRKDSMSTDGFQLKVDYETDYVHKFNVYRDSSAYKFYPVYVVNETKETKLLIGKESRVFAIQEALDSSRRWRPIEAHQFDFCEVGYWGLKVHPNEFVLIVFPKYNGNFETNLRIKLKIRDNIYVSQSFKGTIKYQQFYMDKGGWYDSRMKENPLVAVRTWFYGSIPKEYDK